MTERGEAVFQFINLTHQTFFLLKAQISSLESLSSGLITRSLMAKWASCSFSNNTVPVWYRNTLIYKRPYCANCHLNSKKSDPLLFFYIDFSSKPVKAAVRRAVGLLMKDSVCSDHLDICRCFEASHCLLRASVHSRRPPRATSRPQLSETGSHRTRRELFGREESGAPCKSMKTGGGICKRWVGLRREVCGPPRARQMMLLLEGKTTIAGKEWLLLMVCMPLIKYWTMCVMLALSIKASKNKEGLV